MKKLENKKKLVKTNKPKSFYNVVIEGFYLLLHIDNFPPLIPKLQKLLEFL